MKAKIITVSVLLSVLLMSSCKEVFYPDDIVSDEMIPVIQGTIIENKQPEVNLTWATFYEENGISYINNAHVWITDDAGNNETLEESAPGKYTPVNESFKGILGRTYTLHVETPDGKIYESTPERINSTVQLDSMYAIPMKRPVYVVGNQGKLISKDQKGLDIKISLSKDSDSTCYVRFKTDVLTEITWIRNPNSLNPIDVYEWESFVLDDIYSVRFSFPCNLIQVVPEHEAGFLEFVFNSLLETEEATAPYTYGWVVSMHVYSISWNVYQYYNSIAQQMNANGQIFAPVPSQVKGNLTCVSSTKDKVTGVFEAASEIVFYKGFSWVNPEVYRSLEVDSFPEDLGRGSVELLPPDFWVTFN